jgi:hypothetical protein
VLCAVEREILIEIVEVSSSVAVISERSGRSFAVVYGARDSEMSWTASLEYISYDIYCMQDSE